MKFKYSCLYSCNYFPRQDLLLQEVESVGEGGDLVDEQVVRRVVAGLDVGPVGPLLQPRLGNLAMCLVN